MVFTDTARYVLLPVASTGRVTEIDVSCVLSNTAIYFVEHVSTPGVRVCVCVCVCVCVSFASVDLTH